MIDPNVKSTSTGEAVLGEMTARIQESFVTEVEKVCRPVGH